MEIETQYRRGDKIGGRYEVDKVLLGGMGEVYLCLDLKWNTPFALKTFQTRYLTSSSLRELYEREVATWVALEKHPNIVRCFYMDVIDDRPFMILEWIASDDRYRPAKLAAKRAFGPPARTRVCDRRLSRVELRSAEDAGDRAS